MKKTKNLFVRISEDEHKALHRVAKKRKTTISDLIRGLIEGCIKNK